MKRIICFVLTLCLALSAMATLSSCKKSGIKTSKDTVDLDLSEYTLVYGKELTKGGKDAAGLLAANLKYLSDTTMRAWMDSESEDVATEDPEILVGDTFRDETTRALNRIQGEGWIIAVIGNKLVIVGTTPFLTRVAITYFSENYVQEAAVNGTMLTVSKEILHSNLETVVLESSSGNPAFELVYDDRIDDYDNGGKDKYNYAGDANPTTGGPDADYTYTFTLQVRDKLAETLAIDPEKFQLKDDSGDDAAVEVLIGNMDGREEYVAAMHKLAGNEYGVATCAGKIMLLAWNDVTLPKTLDVLDDMLKGSLVTTDSGKSKYVIPTDCVLTEGVKNAWTVDFPKPDGENISLRGVADVSNDSLEYIYTGDGADSAAFTAYCEKLKAAGYVALAAEWQNEGNRFRTFVNESEKVTLHVSYTHYKYAETYGVTGAYGLPGIRVVAASTDKVTLPTQEMLNSTEYDNETYAKVTTPRLTQLKLAYSAGSFGNAYIITLADGTFIVYDGGRGLEDDVASLWTALNKLFYEAWGFEPSDQHPVHIRAWIMSHEHSDHLTVFRDFCKEYGQNTDLQLDALLFNPVSASERRNSHNPEATIQNNLTTLQGCVNGGFDFIKIHTGQVFYFANLKMEILYTHEDTYPRGLEYFNNSSTIFRTTIKSYGSATTKEKTMIWLGDSERIGGNRIISLYGPTLDADMVQYAHHGVNGVSLQCYQLIDPEVIWWPTSLGNFKNWTSKSNSTKVWYYGVNYQMVNSVECVELILIADTYDTTMKFDGSGNEYSSLYDLEGESIVYSTYSAYTSKSRGGTVIKK